MSSDPLSPVLLVGLGKIGFSILRLLHQLGIPVVVVTRSVPPDWEKPAERLAARFIRGDGRSDDVLREAGVGTARAIIVATNDDLVNLEILLDAQRLAPHTPVVVRMLDTGLAQRVMRDFQVRAALNAADISTPAFVAAALGEDVVRAFDVEGVSLHFISRKLRAGRAGTVRTISAEDDHPVVAVQRAGEGYQLLPDGGVPVSAGDEVVVAQTPRRQDGHDKRSHVPPRASPWVQERVTLWSFLSGAIRHGASPLRWLLLGLVALVVVSTAVFRVGMSLSWMNALYFTITIISTVGFGDIHLGEAPAWVKLYGCALMLTGVSMLFFLYGLFTDYLVRIRVEEAFGQKRSALSDHVIIAGAGDLGARVASRLQRLGLPVLAIEREPDSPSAQSLSEEIPVLRGDATFASTLDRAGVGRARTVVAVTDDDMTNLRIAQETEDANIKARTIVRLFRSRLAAKMGSSLLGADVPLNPSEAAAATFAACALEPDVLHGFTLGERLLLLRKVTARSRGVTEPCSCAEIRDRSRTVALLKSRGPMGDYTALDDDDVIAPGDWLIVLEEYAP